MEQGPCLQHCYRQCTASRAVVWFVATCTMYLVLTRSLGTPFADSLTDAQRSVQQASVRDRRRVFVVSSVLGVVFTSVTYGRPFQS